MSNKRKPKFGQNFLVDDNARHAIVAALGDISNRTVLEIGPGHGAITSLLAPRAGRLIALELDHSLAAELTFKFRDFPNVTIVQGDILETDLATLIQQPDPRSPVSSPLHVILSEAPIVSPSPVILSEAPATSPSPVPSEAPVVSPLPVILSEARSAQSKDLLLSSTTNPSTATIDVIGNLPYYITSDILLQLFAAGRAGLLTRAVLMMQREVADRLAASPGVKDYGLLSATAQMNAQVDNLFTLPPSAFNPPPEVFSTVIRLHFQPRFKELQVDPIGFDAFLKQIFAQKRKTLHNNLRAASFAPEALAAAWPASIPPQARAESLALEPLALLYRALAQGAPSMQIHRKGKNPL